MYLHMHYVKFTVILPVSALLLTSSLLAIGSYEGKINVYKTASLLGSTSESTIVTEPRILHAHKNRVYDLHCLKGCVTTSGHTSLFPTFIGHSAEDVEKEFLISVGSGRGYPSLNKSIVFKNFVCQRGCFVNVWLVWESHTLLSLYIIIFTVCTHFVIYNNGSHMCTWFSNNWYYWIFILFFIFLSIIVIWTLLCGTFYGSLLL